MSVHDIFTATEAAEIWRLEASTVKRACQAGRFSRDEARKSRGTWLVTREGMNRVYGPVTLPISLVTEAIRTGYWPPENKPLPAPLPEWSTDEVVRRLDEKLEHGQDALPDEEYQEVLDSYFEELAREWAGKYGIKLEH